MLIVSDYSAEGCESTSPKDKILEQVYHLQGR